MDNNFLDFKDKKDRNDFYIAIPVILFFAWIIGSFSFCGTEVTDVIPEIVPIAEAKIVDTEADRDGDGIFDKEDKCPNLAGVAANKGCPADRDGDGVYDKDDKCPKVKGSRKLKGCPPATNNDLDGDGILNDDDECPKQAGDIENKGCPKDTDGDGVYDARDKCPTVKGVSENNGCPADRDGDGIADKDDKCPDEKGVAAYKGCNPPKDSDGDRVPDDKDNCPTVKGDINNNGCPMVDSDKDGIPDKADRCPKEFGPAANRGCPEIKLDDSERKLIEEEIKNIQFLSAKDQLKPSSKPILDKVANLMKKYPKYKVAIAGHTDSVGNPDNNLKLSKERAKTCYDFLIKKGIAANRISYNGYGSAKPVADNKTAEGRKKNRRVEFTLNF